MLRALKEEELSIVSGAGDATVTFYDNDNDGKLSNGDEILYYTYEGVNYQQDAWEQSFAFQNWTNSNTQFQDAGADLQWILDNPFETAGWLLDHIDELFNSVELSGSEYIDWKTGGMHNPDEKINISN